jgi:hypothetical protein
LTGRFRPARREDSRKDIQDIIVNKREAKRFIPDMCIYICMGIQIWLENNQHGGRQTAEDGHPGDEGLPGIS